MQVRPSKELSEFLERTGNLLIHLLNCCDLQCRHCYLDASPKGRQRLPIHLVMRTVEEASALGFRSIQFSGGEPLLYRGLHQVLELTKGKRFDEVTLSTNATRIDDRTAGLLADIGANVVTSIDGPPEYHDVFRGRRGSFARSERGISCLIRFGVPVKVVMTVCTDSLEHVDWCARWASGMKVRQLQFQPLQEVGRGKCMADCRLSDEDLYDLFIHLNDLGVSYASRGLKIVMAYQSRDFMIRHPCAAYVCNGKRCHRGVDKELKKIVVREDGSILPELVDIDRRFALGNLHDDTLESCLLNYLQKGFKAFDRLCREVYKETVPNYPSPLIPWNEILAQRSRTFGQPTGQGRLLHTLQT